MTEHQQNVVKALLEKLAERDGGLVAEGMLHGMIRTATHPPASMADFEAALAYCDSRKWVTRVLGPTEKPQWAITAQGEAARRDL
jgi:hypothetical protein